MSHPALPIQIGLTINVDAPDAPPCFRPREGFEDEMILRIHEALQEHYPPFTFVIAYDPMKELKL